MAEAESEDSSDGDTGIGFGKVQQEVKKRRKTKKPDDDPVVNGDQRPAPKAVNKRKANPDVELKSALSAAESCISALGAVQPLQVWTGAIKVKEVDKRLDVAYHCQVSLEEHMLLTDAAAQEAGKKIADLAQNVTEFMDCMVPFMDVEGSIRRASSMDDDDIAKFASLIPLDCMHSMLVEIAKRMLEDSFDNDVLFFVSEF